MTRYIDASKIKFTGLTFEDINNEVYFSLSDVRKAIEQTATADVVEVRHGYWIENEDDFVVMCSECGTEFLDDQIGIVNTYKYCPYCGAKMDGDEDG